MKKFITMIVCTAVLVGGIAGAQSLKNGGYKGISATTSGTAYVVPISGDATYNIVSTEGEWGASFWRYKDGSTECVGFTKGYAGSDTLAVKQNIIYPVTIDCDFILLKGIDSTVEVDLYWYR